MAEAANPATRSEERIRDAWVEHHGRLWRAVLAWSGNRDVAEEAVAEAFAQAIRRGDAINDVGNWVWRAAFRIAAGRLADRNKAEHLAREQLDDASTPDTVVELVDALERLTERDRLVVVLALVGGWPSAEIAGFTGSTSGAVRVRLHRAKAKLRKLLEEDHSD